MAQDRISELPDDLIQRILSFLPSTKQAIRTGILSKRWRKQWTRVPVLIFHSNGMAYDNFLDLDKTLALHDCSKINTFHLCNDHYGKIRFDDKIRFATTKQVEDLALSCPFMQPRELPESLLEYNSLVKLTTTSCLLFPPVKVNWAFLKALNLDRCGFSNRSMQCILSGSPLLESLEVKNCDEHKLQKLEIASTSLEKLVLERVGSDILEISCPHLKKLCINHLSINNPESFDQAIEYVLSKSLLLESFTLSDCRYRFHCPVIASKSLKKLVMKDIRGSHGFEISCQSLEDFKLSGVMNMVDVKFKDVPSSLRATLGFCIEGCIRETRDRFHKDILQQLQHVKELRVGHFIHEVLRDCGAAGASSPTFHIKCLILDVHLWSNPLSILPALLRCLPILETLVFKMFFQYAYGENSWGSNSFRCNCLLSHLKTVKIYGIPRGDGVPFNMLDIVQFILNNARMLQKLTVVSTEAYHKEYSSIVSHKLSSLTRCSEHATVEFISQCP